jgi:signal transduction histidine kinase/CheY-like chemotaxis protein
MIETRDTSYAGLKRRLEFAESALQAIREGQVDTILGEGKTLVVRLAHLEEQLRKSEYQKDLILNATSEMVAYCDTDLHVIWANKALGDALREPVEALAGRHCYELWPGRSEPCDNCPLLLAAATGVFHQTELRTADERVWQVRGYPVKDEKGDLIALIEFTQEITAQRQAEAEKEALEFQARQLQKAESLHRMAGAIAHHFNNQLQGVTGYLELAMEDLKCGAEPAEAITQAMQAAQGAARVSRQMLTYLGQTPSERKIMDLSEACRVDLPMLRACIPANITLEADLPSPGPGVKADRNQVEQILTNLVSNASESMGDSGGVIRLTVKTVSGEDILAGRRFPVDWRPKVQAYACLEVKDNGPGIPEHDIEKLFDPFFSTKFTGRGLGLSVVSGIIQAHGGCIAVESRCGTGKSEVGGQRSEDRGQRSEVGGQNSENLCVSASLRENLVGSVFRVFLPLMEGEAPRTEKKPLTGGDAPWRGGKVLLVEDTEQVRKLGVRMLERLGWQVIAATDGVEGVELFRTQQNDIRFVLSDLSMPGMDGWKTIEALRGLRPNIPVILVSGYDEATVMSGDHAELPQVFLGKPYGFDELREAISRIIEPQMDTDGRG